MKPLASLLFAATLLLSSAAQAAPEIGKPAPAFRAIDSHGKVHAPGGYQGKVIVLEWTNHDCPYTIKHYESNNMQTLQKDSAADGIVWLSVISSAPGTQGHVSPAEANRLTETRDAAPAAVLLDAEGTMGHAYEARTTPHMYVIDAAGTLVYMGGIDDIPSARVSDIDMAHNYVRAALDDLKAGRPVQDAVTRPYGCSVKYR